MLIYPKPLVSRTHGLRLSKDAGNEAGWDAREEFSTHRLLRLPGVEDRQTDTRPLRHPHTVPQRLHRSSPKASQSAH